MGEEVDDDVASKRGQDAVAAESFAQLVELVGGSTAAARILGRSRNAVDKWTAGKSRLPFVDYLRLAIQADRLSLAGFAGGEEAIATGRTAPPVIGAPAGEDYVELPRLRVVAGAGPGRIAVPDGDEEPEQFLAAKASWLRSIGVNPARAEALTAVGDSMEPTIRDGDVLLVDRGVDRVVDNGIYVVVVAGAVVVKRLTLRTNGALVLRSDNERHAEEVVPPSEVHDLVIEGRVRWCGRPM